MKIRMQSSWEIKNNDDGIEIFSTIKRKRYKIKSKSKALISFINLLKQGIKIPHDIRLIAQKLNIAENFLYSLIDNLKVNEIVIPDTKESSYFLIQETLYDRQIRFFHSYERTGVGGKELNECLQNSSVLITGLGGYGSWIALLCARMGIKTIIGVDFDRVEITNLHRQVLYDRSDIGKLKVEACRKKITDSDPDINFIGKNLKINSSEDLLNIMSEVDLVINPFSYVPYAEANNHVSGMVAKAALAAKKPCLTFGGSWAGPLTIPGETPCYFCSIKVLEHLTNLDAKQRNPAVHRRAFAPPIATCCSLAAFEAARFLSKCDSSQVMEGIIQLDIFSFSNSQFLSIQRDFNCPFCSFT